MITTNFLKRSHITTPNTVMPVLTAATSHLLEGPYLFAALDDFCGLPTISRQTFQTPLIEHPARHISTSSGQENETARRKRLTMDQTKSLECSFAVNSKLGSQKKNKLALELGLQPRQVAIWYQNKRSRTKTMNLEEKYDSLKMQFQGVLQEKSKLEAEVIKLREQLGLHEKVKLGAKEIKTVVEKKQEAATSTNNYKDYCKKPSQGAALGTTKEVITFPMEQRRRRQQQQQQEDNGMDGGDGDDTSGETEAKSEDISCATAQNELALDAESPASDCTYHHVNNNTKPGSETQVMHPYVQQQELYGIDHLVLNYNHHQHQLLQQLQQQYNLSNFSQLVGDGKLENDGYLAQPTALLTQVDDQLFDDYRFNLEDDTASLYFDLATQA